MMRKFIGARVMLALVLCTFGSASLGAAPGPTAPAPVPGPGPVPIGDPDMYVYVNTVLVSDGGTDAMGSGFQAQQPVNRTYTVRNTGQATLNLTGSPIVEISGVSGCTASVSTQPAASIASGSSSNFIVTITPTQGGVFSYNVSIKNDDPVKNPYDFKADGTAAAAACEMDVDFAGPVNTPVPDGSTQALASSTVGSGITLNYTIMNAGGATLNLTANPPVAISGQSNCTASVSTQPAATIAPAGSTSMAVVANPVAAGAFEFLVSIDNNDSNENPYNWRVLGMATGTAEMDVQRPAGTSIASGGNDALGALTTGIGTGFIWTVANSGNIALNLTGSPAVAISNAVNCTATLSVAPAATVSPSQSTTFTLDVVATIDGSFSFTFSIANNDPNENPYLVNCTGTSSTPAPEIDLQRPAGTSLASGSTDNVGSQTIGTPVTITYTIANSGNLALNLSGNPRVAISNLTNCSASVTSQPAAQVAVSGVSSFDVTFTVTAAVSFSFSLSIANDDANENPYTLDVQGMGANVPEMGLLAGSTSIPDGGSHTLGMQVSGVAVDVTFTVENTGLAALNLTGSPRVVLAGMLNCAATVTAQPQATVGAGSTTTFVVSVTPTAAGPFSVNISIASNDGDENPYQFALGGTAQTIGLGGTSGGASGGGCVAGSGDHWWLVAVLAALAALRFARRRAA